MTIQRFANRASALLTTTLLSSGTAVLVESGGGSRFPTLVTGQVTQAALVAATGDVEYVTITAVTGDNLTVLRAQEGTAALTFPAGSRIEQRLTATVMDGFLQKAGGVMTGPLNMNNQPLQQVDFDPSVFIENIHCNLVRSTAIPLGTPYTPAENSILIPTETTAFPTIFGAPIITAAFLRLLVFDAYINLALVPFYLKLCDGTNGTPDLRNLFVIGASPVLPVGTIGGTPDYTTNPAGGFPDETTTPTLLNSTNLPGIITVNPTFGTQIGSADGQRAAASSNSRYDDADVKQHTHNVHGKADHQHTISGIYPPFMALAKVMFNI